MSSQHERFQERLKGSSRAVFVVAQMQHAKGRSVEIPRVRIAPSADVADDYIDDGDFFMLRRVDVKRLRFADFTGAGDWPFPHVFVSRVEAADRAIEDNVIAFVVVSRNYKHIAQIHHSTQPHWYKVQARARNTGNLEWYYACPIELVTFEKVPPELLFGG